MDKLLLAVLGNPVWTWVQRFGGPGLILLGLADNSIVPLPGSMDVVVILLSAQRRTWWPYYGFMATLGAVLGGYVTYRIAEKGGEETLEKKIGKQRAEKVYAKFKRRGFIAVFVGAILPPPFPIVPFLMAAGILHYPTKNFLLSLASGRAVRFFAVAFVGHIYGQFIIDSLREYYKPVLYSLIGLAVAGALSWVLYVKWYRPRVQRKERASGEKVESWPIPGRHPEQESKKQGGPAQR